MRQATLKSRGCCWKNSNSLEIRHWNYTTTKHLHLLCTPVIRQLVIAAINPNTAGVLLIFKFSTSMFDLLLFKKKTPNLIAIDYSDTSSDNLQVLRHYLSHCHQQIREHLKQQYNSYERGAHRDKIVRVFIRCMHNIARITPAFTSSSVSLFKTKNIKVTH